MDTNTGSLSKWLEMTVIVLTGLDEFLSADVVSILIGVRKTSLLGSLDKAKESNLGDIHASRFSLGRSF